jgi:hypothetical protein
LKSINQFFSEKIIYSKEKNISLSLSNEINDIHLSNIQEDSDDIGSEIEVRNS